MRASVINALGGRFSTEEVEISDPRASEVLVDVRAAGLCHTDLTFAEHGISYAPPFVLGHEVAGVVAAVGPDVTDVRVGDHVVGCSIQFCGRCLNCISGMTYRCTRPHATLRSPSESPRLERRGEVVTQCFGVGGFAQQALIHENQLAVVPKDMPFPQAALLGCGVVTGAGAVLNAARVQPGAAVVVIGAGGVGLNAISAAALAGASRVIVVDIHDAKLDTARRFGATDVVNSASDDPVALVLELTNGAGADAVFDFVGIGAVTQQAVSMLAVGGGLYLVGVVEAGASVSLDIMTTVGTQRRIQGVAMGSSTFKRDIPLYADLYLSGRMELDGLVSREISLDAINEGYESLNDGHTARVVITDFS